MAHHTCYDCQPTPETIEASHQKKRHLWMALILVVSFAVTELWIASSSHSLALSADAGHLLSDGLALAIALLATWMTQLPASDRATFGYRRVEILAALVNGIGLGAIALWIIGESLSRLSAPPIEIVSAPMVITATIGLAVNSLNALLLHNHSHHDLNVRGAFLHMLADAASSVGVIGAALCVWLFDWNWADGAISLLVAVFILLSAVPLIRQSLDILLEKTPNHINLAQLHADLANFEGVVAIEALHVWTIALGYTALTARLQINTTEGEARDRLLQTIQTSLQQTFGIQEVWLQMTTPVPTPLVNLSFPHRLDLAIVSGSDREILPRCDGAEPRR